MAAKIEKGTKFRGVYMGGAFTGTVIAVESDSSSYPGTQNDVRVYVQIDADLVRPSVYRDPTSAPWKSHSAGDSVVMLCEVHAGLLTRTDDKFEDLYIRRA